MTKEMMNQLVAEVTARVEAMKVVEMRKEASVYAIKNAKQYKREELAAKLIERIVAVEKSSIEAQAEAEAKEAKKAQKAEKATKKVSEKKADKKAEDTAEKKDKRYKAEKVDEDAVDKLVEEIVSATPAQVEAMDLYNINRKVLIEVMKQLHCKLWYRTYDKPTMIAKITVAIKKEGK